MNKKSTFYSYTPEEGYHTARAWALIALGFAFLVGAVLMKATSHDAYAYSPYYAPASDVAFSAGVMAGLMGAGAIAGCALAMRELVRAGRLRRQYKLANPTMFNSAGEPIEAAA